MNSGRRRFLGAIAGTAASVLLPRGACAVVMPGSTGWSPWGTAAIPETLLPDATLPDPVPVDRAPALLPRALAALDRHGARIADHGVVGLVDFSVASHTPRLHIVDVANGRVIASHLVAHGRGSDPANSGWAQQFSNRLGSEASSSGAFVIGETYLGRHGRSRRVIGLDPENDQAEVRGIVIHAASYVDPDFVTHYGRIGRSQGCFAVGMNDVGAVLDQLSPGRLLFAAR